MLKRISARLTGALRLRSAALITALAFAVTPAAAAITSAQPLDEAYCTPNGQSPVQRYDVIIVGAGICRTQCGARIAALGPLGPHPGGE
jgi:hypothetical protein